jgi:hypothetical protein
VRDTVEERAQVASEALRMAADLRATTVSSTRSRRAPVVVLAAAAVVVVIAAVAVGLARHGSRNGGGGLTIEALAATTQQQSARITITQTLPSDPSDRHPYLLLTTGVVDYRTGNGRFDTSTKNGSGPAQPFESGLVVDGRHYMSIGPGLEGIPERIFRTKKWIYEDTRNASVQLSGLNPFDPFGSFKDLHITLKDRGTATFNGQTVEHYTATGSISSPPSLGSVQKATLAFDVYVDSHGRVTHIRVDQKAANSTIQIDFSDYGVHVDVTAPPANLVVRASDLPSNSAPTPTSGRQGALVLRQDLDTSAAECKTPGALAHTEYKGSKGPELCTRLGATIATGDDVTSALARPEAGTSNGWCLAPTFTADGLAQLNRYIQANEPVPDLFVISHGAFLGEVSINGPIHNGDCWIVTDRMTATTARALAAELSSK